MFNDIIIDRVDQSTGNQVKQIIVPLAYGPKERFLVRLQENPDLLKEVNQILPRMAFEITGIKYAPERKLPSTLRNRSLSANGSSILNSQYTPVPYDLKVRLSVLAANADDSLRIVEQIFPFFTPAWTTSINILPEMNITMDIPIVLDNVAYQDTYDGKFTDRYAIVWDLDFTIKGYYFGPINASGVIKEVITNFHTNSSNNENIFANTPIDEYITIVPGLTANGQPTSNISLSINTNNISANSNYGYITDFFSNVG